MAFRARALVVSSALSAVGCSLLTSIPDVTSENGKPHPAAAADADADADASRSGGDGSVAGFCAAETPRSTFCDDFDDRTDSLAPPWEIEGAVKIDSAVSRSPSHSLFAGPPAPGDCKYSVVKRTWGPSYRASRLGFAMHLAAPLPPEGGSVTGQSLKVGSSRCQVALSLGPSESSLYEQIITPSGQILHSAHDLPTISEGAWHDVTIDYDPDAKIVVTIDGSTVLSDPVAQSCPQGRGEWLTSLGWHCLNNAPSTLSVHLDNVTFDPR